MKKLNLAICCVLFSAAIANAGIFRESAKVVESASRVGYKAAKPASKVASYPVRHPVKSAKKSASAAKKVAY